MIKEGWTPKNWCLLTVVLEKTLESPLDSKAIKPINPKGNRPWLFIGRTDAEAEAQILWPASVSHQVWKKSWLIGKKKNKQTWCWERLKQKEKRATEDEMLRWYWEGNRQEGQGLPNRGNRLQVPDIFISHKWQDETNQQYVFLLYTNLKGGFS